MDRLFLVYLYLKMLILNIRKINTYHVKISNIGMENMQNIKQTIF